MIDEQQIRVLKAACGLVVAAGRRGTAYLIRSDTLLTCFHVVSSLADGEQVLVQFLHCSVSARVKHLERALDCSLLLLDNPLDVQPLRLAQIPPQRGMECVTFGFPLAMQASGALLDGKIQDGDALDLMKRPALAFESTAVTPNADLTGLSGSPVFSGGCVIGQLVQIAPDEQGKPMLGKVFATPAVMLAKLLPPDANKPQSLLRQSPPTPYYRVAYIERPVEEKKALAVLEYPGKAVALRAPSRVGTTWLLMHLGQRLATEGELVFVDLNLCIGDPAKTSADDFLRALVCHILDRLADALEISDVGAILSEYWGSDLNASTSANSVMSRGILPLLEQKQRLLILALDGVERLDQLSERNQILAVLRCWVAQGNENPWKQLRLILSLSTVTSLFASNIYQSPFFTVAQLIDVADLNNEQVSQLATLHGVPWGKQDQEEVHSVIGGNAYLVHLLFHECRVTGKSYQVLMSPQYGLFSDYLKLCKERLSRSPELRSAFAKALRSPRSSLEQEHYDRLKEAGFLDQDQKAYRPRYGIHRRL